ncbi:hypothetical protein pb186bvf_003791 [Paramecium bursaria]
MDNKSIRQSNFQKKITIDESIRQKAIKQVKLSEKDNQIIEDFIDAKETIFQLDKIEQQKLKKEKIDPFFKKAVKDYKSHLKILKHGWNSHSNDRRNSHVVKQKDAKKIDFNF